MAISSNADVAAKVRGVAAEQGATQAYIAAHLSLSEMAVSRRMSGSTPFSPEELLKVGRLFGVPVGAFFGESISDLPAPAGPSLHGPQPVSQGSAPAVDHPPVGVGGLSS